MKATDEIEDDAIRTVKMQMRGWIVVDIKDVFDLKAGTFNKEWMKKSVREREGNEDFLGFLRIRWMNLMMLVFMVMFYTGKTGSGISSPQIRINLL